MESQSSRAAPRGDTPISPGTVLGGRFEVQEAADEGAFGTLYRGKNRTDGTAVTIEVLDQRLFGDSLLRQTVRRELESLTGLEHKNLATPLAFGDETLPTGTICWIAMEHLDGQSLAEMHEKKRAQGKPFSMKGAYNVVAHLANGLAALAPRGTHSGLSMRSVHVSSQGRVKVLELGLARALLAGGARGALAQAVPSLAPEALTNPDKVGVRSDVFAVGAILYELVSGRQPDSPPVPPSTFIGGLPRSLDVFLDQCLRTRPEDRFPDLARLKEALQAAVGSDIVPTGTTPSMNAVPTEPGPGAAVPPPQSASSPVLSSAPAPARAAAPPPRPPATPPQQPPSSKSMPASRSAPAMPPASRSAPAMPAATRNGPPLPGAVPTSFNVDSALSSIDESHERWLIQKDKLDFGPFNLRDVRAQIEAGKILSDHTIVDTESGERRRVKDHPALREMVTQAEAVNAENERMRSEASARSKHRGRVVTLLGFMMLVVLGGGGATFWYLQHMKEKVVVVKETVESDLKFDITMKVDPPEKKTGGAKKPHTKTVNGKNVFDDTTTLGDASEGGGDETLDGATVQRVMTQNFKVLVGCVREERGRNAALRNVDMDFIIKGSGSVTAVKVNGQTTGAFASCMLGKMQAVSFPKFNGSKTHASFSLALK